MDNKREVKQVNGVSNEDNSDLGDQNASSANKQKRKRRSKNDAEGRSFKCVECGKSYLSQPALTNHKKTKHNYGANGEKKGRGRPRKNPPVTPANDTSEKKFRQFFENQIRKAKEGEKITVDDVKEGFSDIFSRYNSVFDKSVTAYEDHPFYSTLMKSWNEEIKPSETNKPQDASNINSASKPRQDQSCDEIFLNYLKEVASKTNKEYFHFIFKFLILFRECINKMKKNEGDTEQFTTTNNAESVPDTCNDFIVEFMDPNDYYGLDTNELIEAIQHLCYWLYVNNYTTSRLTLL